MLINLVYNKGLSSKDSLIKAKALFISLELNLLALSIFLIVLNISLFIRIDIILID